MVTDDYTCSYLVVGPEPLALPPQNDAVVAFLKSPALSSVPLSFSFPCTLHTVLVPFQMPFLQVPCKIKIIIKFWQAFQTFSFMNMLKVLNYQLGLPVLENINMHL